MIPRIEAPAEYKIISRPTKTFRLGENYHITSTIDGLDAVEQAICLILNTERYRYFVVSWNYGVELDALIGQPIQLIIPELPRRITEALTQDDRVTSVDGFELERDRGKLHVSFIAHTIYGDLRAEKEVEL